MIEIEKENENSYRFTLKSESGTTLLASALLRNENEAREIVKRLAQIIQKRTAFERKTNHIGKFIFNVKQPTGEIIGTSQPYDSEAGMENGIENVKKRVQYLNHRNQL